MSTGANPSRKSSWLPLLLAGCGVLTLLSICCVGVGGSAFLRYRTAIPDSGPVVAPTSPDESRQSTFTPTPLEAELKYLPDKIPSLESIRVDQMEASSVYAELRKQRADKIKERDASTLESLDGVVRMSDIARLTAVGIAPWAGGAGLTIITTRGPVNRSQVEAKLFAKGHDKQVLGPATLFPHGKFIAYCVPTNNLILRGDRSEIESILRRNGNPVFDAAMKKAFNAADFSKTRVEISDSGSGPSGNGPWGSFNPALFEGKEDLDDFVVHQTGWGTGIWSRTIVFPRKIDDSRRIIETQIKAQPDLSSFPEMKQAYAAVKVAQETDRLLITGSIPPDHIARFVEKGKLE